MAKRVTKKDIEKKIKQGTLPSVNLDLFGNKTVKSEENTNPDEMYYSLIEMVKIENTAFFLGKNVPSLKNSKEILQINTGKSNCCNAVYVRHGVGDFTCTKCNKKCMPGKRPIISKSNAVKQFHEYALGELQIQQQQIKKIISELNLPLHIGFYFIRGSKHSFDYDNAMTTMLDIFRDVKLITDDDSSNVMAYPLGSHYSQENQGVIFTFMLNKPIFNLNTKNLLPI